MSPMTKTLAPALSFSRMNEASALRDVTISASFVVTPRPASRATYSERVPPGSLVRNTSQPRERATWQSLPLIRARLPSRPRRRRRGPRSGRRSRTLRLPGYACSAATVGIAGPASVGKDAGWTGRLVVVIPAAEFPWSEVRSGPAVDYPCGLPRIALRACAFGGGVIGNTTGSGPVIEGSSPSPRARADASQPRLVPSSSGPGRRPLKPVTPVRIWSGLQKHWSGAIFPEAARQLFPEGSSLPLLRGS